jgi:NAD(P)-dependent dehydrogenase (short-subunit alcohol dehydrogenase family)
LYALEDPRRTAQAYWGAYGAAKAGLEHLLCTVAAEYRNTGPRVLGVRLPALRSGLRQLAFPAEPPDRAADPAPYAACLVELLRRPVAGPVLDWSSSGQP